METWDQQLSKKREERKAKKEAYEKRIQILKEKLKRIEEDKGECKTCEEDIVYEERRNQWELVIETSEWIESNDWFTEENLPINFCPECGKDYRGVEMEKGRRGIQPMVIEFETEEEEEAFLEWVSDDSTVMDPKMVEMRKKIQDVRGLFKEFKKERD